jgi:5-methylcytosine-specific restriction endonuclease McrA
MEYSKWKRPMFKLIPEIKNKVWEKTGGFCTYCHCKLLPFGSSDLNSFTVDHIVAIRDGGTNDIDNLVPACKTCNARKGSKDSRHYKKGKSKYYRDSDK